MGRSKIGFHGTGTGIVDNYMKPLDQARIPFRIKAVSNGGLAMEAAQLARASGVKHQIIARWPKPAGRANDHPLTYLPALEAAQELYSWISIQLSNTPEIHPYKDLIRIEPTNEISTSDEDPSWVGFVILHLAQFLNADGWMAALGGFNNGQPEPEHWDTPGLKALLEYVAQHPENTISVHEGKTTTPSMYTPISDLVPHIIGRFQYILEAADRHGLRRPGIEVTEWGWAYNNIVDQATFQRELDELARFYAQHPEVIGAYLWNLDKNPNWGSLPNTLASYIPIVKDYTLATDLPDPNPQPPVQPPAGDTFQRALWETSLANQVLFLNQDAAIQKKAAGDGFVVTDNEFRMSWEGQVYAGQGADRYIGSGYERRVYYCKDGDWGNIDYLTSPEDQPEIPNLGLTVPISGPFVTVAGGHFDDPRDYSHIPWCNQRHEGLDFASWNPAAKALAPKNGRVIFVGYSDKGYGHYVILEHTDPIYFRTYVSHMASAPYVTPGQLVSRRQPLGPVGSTGNSTGNHVHLTVQVPDLGLDGYCVADVVDPADHLDFTVIPITPTPPPVGTTLIGLHATADPVLALGELDVFMTARPDIIKVFSNIDPLHLAQLKARHPGVKWIIRAYLSMWENGHPRNISAQQFYNDTIGDVSRSLQVLGDQDITIELHNEPNLAPEGLGGSWANGSEFSAWYIQLENLYKNALQGRKFAFPGLSPGPAIPGVRQEKYAFLDGCFSAMVGSDYIGDHAYWGVGDTVQDAIQAVRDFRAYILRKGMACAILVTEASDKGPGTGSAKGQKYLEFWTGLKSIDKVAGVTYFVASASHPDFQNEVWVKNGASVGMAEIVGGRT